MTSFLQRVVWPALQFLGVLVTVVGGGFVLADNDLMWLYWLLIIVVALPIALFYALRPIRKWIRRIRDYQRVLELLADANEDRQALRDWQVNALAGRDGFEEVLESRRELGQTDVKGALASLLVEPPRLVSKETHDGVLRLYAEGSAAMPVGTRFDVHVGSAGISKGTVEAVSLRDDLFEMRCVDAANGDWWEHLESEAEFNHAAPEGVQLRPYGTVPQELLDEVRSIAAQLDVPDLEVQQ